MNVTEDTQAVVSSSVPAEVGPPGPLDRRADVEAKQSLIADWLKEVGCDGLLVLQPENFAWLTAGGIARGIVDPEASPALYFSAEGRG